MSESFCRNHHSNNTREQDAYAEGMVEGQRLSDDALRLACRRHAMENIRCPDLATIRDRPECEDCIAYAVDRAECWMKYYKEEAKNA